MLPRHRIEFKWYHWAVVVVIGVVGALPVEPITVFVVNLLGSVAVAFIAVWIVVSLIRRFRGEPTTK